jgi:hypothetical protein
MSIFAGKFDYHRPTFCCLFAGVYKQHQVLKWSSLVLDLYSIITVLLTNAQPYYLKPVEQ